MSSNDAARTSESPYVSMVHPTILLAGAVSKSSLSRESSSMLSSLTLVPITFTTSLSSRRALAGWS